MAMLSSFLTPFMGSSINVALPTIGDEFNMSAIMLSWVATSYLLAAATFLVPLGRFADIRGRKKIFIIGMWVFAVASVLCAFAPSSTMLIAFRWFQGIGAAMIFGTSIALLTSVYPAQERGKALGMTVSVVYIGGALGPVLGGFLTSYLGWRSIFLVIIPGIAAVIWIGSKKLVGDWYEARGEEFDHVGSLFYVLAITAVIIGFTFLREPLGLALTIAGTVILMIFIAWEMRHASPVFDMRLFSRNRVFAFSNLAALINYSATFGVSFLVSLYLQYVRGYSPEQTGMVLVSQMVVMALFSPIAGRLSDVIEPRIIASTGMCITAIGLALISFFDDGTAVWMMVVVLGFLGFGFALFSSPNTNAIMSSVDRRQFGTASASVGTMRLVGQVLSLGIATIFISIYLGSQELTSELAPQFLNAFQPAFITFSILCLLGTLASLSRGRVRAS
ncbi:MAG: MFS transporter [Thermoplasmata archaeon]|nr:MFS transporter [Thermoplasmata archaeon]